MILAKNKQPRKDDIFWKAQRELQLIIDQLADKKDSLESLNENMAMLWMNNNLGSDLLSSRKDIIAASWTKTEFWTN
jgi:hypothetical protein